MIDINLKYHAALFGPMDDISPKPEVLTYFISALSEKEFIPTTVQEISPTGVKNLLSLKTTDNVWVIEFGTKRIDISKTDQNIGDSDFGDKEMFINEANEIIEIIFDKYPKQLNRLSFVTHYFLKKMTQDEMLSIFKKIMNPIGIYNESEPIEWNSRVVTRLSKEIIQTNELFNVISEINRVRGKVKIKSKQEQIDRVQLKFDINTFQGNTEYRFGLDEINSFFEVANEIEEGLMHSYSEEFNNN